MLHLDSAKSAVRIPFTSPFFYHKLNGKAQRKKSRNMLHCLVKESFDDSSTDYIVDHYHPFLSTVNLSEGR